MTFNALTFDTQQLDLSERQWLGKVYGPAKAACLQQMTQSHDRLFVVVASSSADKLRIESELKLFEVEYSVLDDWEILPYDPLSPDASIVSSRLTWFKSGQTSGILVLSASTLMQRIAPPSWLLGQHFDYRVGDKLDIERERERLVLAGYRHTELVDTPGEFSIRGSLIDLFATGQKHPLRLDLFDDEIETIRLFEAETQRTLILDDGAQARLDHFSVLPAHEMPVVTGLEQFKQNFTQAFERVNPRHVPLYQSIIDNESPEGLENYLPLFFDQSEFKQNGHLFSYLPKDCVFIIDHDLGESQQDFWQSLTRRYDDLGHDLALPQLPPDALYFNPDQVAQKLSGYGQIICSATPAPRRAGAYDLPFEPLPLLSLSDHKAPFDHLNQFLASEPELKLLIACDSRSRETLIIDLFAKNQIELKRIDRLEQFSAHAIVMAQVDRGFYQPGHFALVTETELFERELARQVTQKKAAISSDFFIKSVHELKVGDPVVHIEQGIGRYAGLQRLELGGGEQEFIKLSYSDDASLYVPVTQLHVISRYSGGDPKFAPLHRLGSDKWSKAKDKALKKIFDVAAELLEVQAKRDAKPGLSFSTNTQNIELFESEFEFEETPDQLLAIESVKQDMAQAKPMDRLICGDVGFGKTEVAMRAAFIAADSGYQVAVLVPTTLLAEQHEESFKNRFNDWPIRVEAISRFATKKKIDDVLKKTAEGLVDILIGTHRLLQADVRFKQLGLMIVDEEHRFGVRHKEKIKRMSTEVDMLTLTATPIPRTLNMSLSGMRDLSIIATPPRHRLATKTFVLPKTESLLKEAILRELLRGGQVYYVHNDINSIERVAQNIRDLVPEAKLAVGHGQMSGPELERVMEGFYHKKTNVLVCTTIIETGIDISNANTILIERADKFGLAQLHQLRGRVGRSHHQGYAYLLVPSLKGLSGDAKKRLKAIERANALGSGFILASEDLEIRGAGELLGSEQSGNMNTIGYSLYMDYLKKATRALKNGEKLQAGALDQGTCEINLHTSTLIPEDYVHDVHQRLLFYRRISDADSVKALYELKHEIIDRFGSMPVLSARLFDLGEIRLMAEALGVSRIDAADHSIKFEFAADTKVDAMKIIRLIQSDSKHYAMNGVQGIKYHSDDGLSDPETRIAMLKSILTNLSATEAS